jgi:hypothetical protein
MPRVGIETTTPVFERTKTVHALDREAIMVGNFRHISNAIRMVCNAATKLQDSMLHVYEYCRNVAFCFNVL